MPDRVVLVGGAVRRPREVTTCVNFEGPQQNVLLGIERVAARLRAEIPPRLLDLLEIAAAVYAADQLIARGGRTRTKWGADWRRRLSFRIGVRDLDFWQAEPARAGLRAAVEFLTGDEPSFEFIRSESPAASSAYFDFDPQLDGAFVADDVVLFSGGLDSLAGAVETLATTDRRVVLVTHLAAPKVHAKQKDLADQLTKRYPGRVFWLPIKVTLKDDTVDRTQRSRTLLFAAMAFLAAKMFDARRVVFFENGIVSLNLPISEQVVGTMATRTTHPRSLLLMQDVLQLVAGEPIAVDNPYFWRTKSDVVETICRHGASDLIRRSFSCSHVLQSTSGHPHCGRCSQCIDRRFGVLGAGAAAFDPAEAYGTDLLIGQRSHQTDQTMVVDYVRRARSCAGIDARTFVSKYGSELGRMLDCFPGLSADEIVAGTCRLHAEHSAIVERVLEEGLHVHGKLLVAGQVPDTALLRLVMAKPGSATDAQRPRREQDPPPNRHEAASGDAVLELVDTPGSAPLRILGLGELVGPQKLLVRELQRQHQADANLPLEKCRYVSTKTLSDRMGWSPENVRQTVKRCRDEINEFYFAIHGELPAEPLLIQSIERRGYRLDPRVRFVSDCADQAVAERDVSRSSRGTVTERAPRH